MGIETVVRVSQSVGSIPHEGLGFHGPGLFGTFAAVASASRALGLSAEDAVHAPGHAGQQEATLMFTHHGGMGKGYVHGNPLEIELTDGTVLSAWGKARGDAENPVHREDAVDKFNKLTTGRLSPQKQAAVIALCERLDTIDDVAAFGAILTA